jgi:hypothetical protein
MGGSNWKCVLQASSISISIASYSSIIKVQSWAYVLYKRISSIDKVTSNTMQQLYTVTLRGAGTGSSGGPLYASYNISHVVKNGIRLKGYKKTLICLI